MHHAGYIHNKAAGIRDQPRDLGGPALKKYKKLIMLLHPYVIIIRKSQTRSHWLILLRSPLLVLRGSLKIRNLKIIKKQKTNKQTLFTNNKQQHFSKHTHEPKIQTKDKTRHALFSASGKQQRYELSRGQCSVAYANSASSEVI